MVLTDKYDLHTISYSVSGWDAILATDMEKLDTVIATRIFGVIGETVAQYQAVYIKSDGKFWLAKADGTAQPAIGLMIESGVADDEKRIQRVGEIVNTGWAWSNVGEYIYLDPDTYGSLTQTRPAENIQVMGVALSSTSMFFSTLVTTNRPYELGGTFNSNPDPGACMLRTPIPRDVVFSADLDKSLMYANTSTTASATFSIKKNGAEFATIDFEPDTLINAAAAVDSGGGKVGIPITSHGFSTGQKIILSGTTNYDGTYAVDTDSSTNEVVIVATYVAETFTGIEEVIMSWGFFTCASAVTFSAGDIFEMFSPDPKDLTLGDFGWTLVGNRL